MPKMDGLEATKHIQEEWAEEERPNIYALTANVLKSDRVQCLAAGMEGFIPKPFHVKELAHALEECGRKRSLQQF